MLRSETAAEPARLQAALAGLRRYQEAERAPSPAPMPVLAERHGAALRDYGGDGPITLFIPSLINPPNVLDMGERSLLRWLAGQGRRAPSSASKTGPMTGRPSPAPPPARCSKACSATTCPAADSGGWTQP